MGCHGIVCNSNLVYLKARSGVFNTYTTMSASDSDTTQVLDFDLDVDMHHAWIPDAYDMDTDSTGYLPPVAGKKKRSEGASTHRCQVREYVGYAVVANWGTYTYRYVWPQNGHHAGSNPSASVSACRRRR